jgi:hypothetical protein
MQNIIVIQTIGKEKILLCKEKHHVFTKKFSEAYII